MPSSIEAHDLVEWAKINFSDTPVEGPFALIMLFHKNPQK